MNKEEIQHFKDLYNSHRKALRRQGKSESTIKAYSYPIRRITKYFNRCPDTLTVEDLKRYFDFLITSHSWSTIKVDRNALQFFYKHVLNIQWQWIDIVRPPRVKKLPDILTPNEIALIIRSTQEIRYSTFVFTAYSMGLRLSETLNLKVGDIDSQRMKIHIRNAKGRKDRYVILPATTLKVLRRYWLTHQHPTLIFPGGATSCQRHRAKAAMNASGVQKYFKLVIGLCNIHKEVSLHGLRHCYGTHLVEGGLNLRAIQHQMGHASSRTTELYTHLSEPVQQNAADAINLMVNHLTDLLREGST